MGRRFLSHWRGVLLSLIGIVTTVWLALTDQLGLYIHPRYFVFTVVMAAIAGVIVLVAFAVLPSMADPDGHAPESPPAPTRGTGWWVGASAILVVGTAIALLALPPSILSTSTVEQRDMNGSVAAAPQGDSVDLVGGDYNTFTVKDWASLLRQGADEGFLADKTPTVVGFVTPDADDPENVFYVARFVITCCAVDAQPIGVPVYSPGWSERYAVDDWVSVSGQFIANPSISSLQALVISPTDISPTETPAQPYVY